MCALHPLLLIPSSRWLYLYKFRHYVDYFTIFVSAINKIIGNGPKNSTKKFGTGRWTSFGAAKGGAHFQGPACWKTILLKVFWADER